MSRRVAGRPARFSRERIGEVAFEIADREGFEAVSMRRVARELGSGTMTLYHYVRTKDDLVALMDDHAMAALLVPPEQLQGPWREALSAILRQTYRMRVLHPWSAVALQNAAYGRNALRHTEQTLAALEGSPFSDEQKFLVMAVTDAFVDGFALRVAEAAARSSTPPPGADAERIAQEVATGPYPLLRQAIQRPEAEARTTADWLAGAFEAGLQAVLDGLAAQERDA